MSKKDAEEIKTVIKSAHDGKFDAEVNRLLDLGWHLMGSPKFSNKAGTGVWGTVGMYKEKAKVPPLKKMQI